MLRAMAALSILAAGPPAAPDPCRAASAPLPATPGLSASAKEPVEAYRAAWRRACDPAAPAADLAVLLGDAEALAADVATAPVLERLASALGVSRAAEWPLPGLRREGGAPVEVDWAAFGAVAGRGTAEDGRFWRGAAFVAGSRGEPAWFGERLDGGAARCLRLGELPFREVADVLDAMEQARAEPYARHVRALRRNLTETLDGLARRREVCACLPGDGAAALEPLAAEAAAARRGTPARRALAKAAARATEALRAGRVRVLALRASPGAPAAGCGTAP